MKISTQKEKGKLNKTLLVLLDELEEECLKVVKLTEVLKIENLTDEQTEDILGELSGSVTHIRVHSEQLEQIIEKELDKD